MRVGRKAGRTHGLLDSGVQVLLDALPVEDMPTLCLNCIFGDVVAKATDSCFADVLGRKGTRIVLTAQNQVRMASHLSHAGEPTIYVNQ